MESTIVIKVRYADTLWRYNAPVNENNQLDLNMVGLKSKIRSHFNFAADSNLMLRYMDQDSDWVTLVDDDDLNDMMRQRLPYLRTDVHMSNDSGAKSSALSNDNVAIADVLKSVHEPLNNALSSLCLVSKALSSASPVFYNLADTISEVGKPIPNSDSQPDVAAGPSSKNGAPGEHAISETEGPKFRNVNRIHITSGSSSKKRCPSDPARGLQPVCGDSFNAMHFHDVANFMSEMREPVPNSLLLWPHVMGGVPQEHVWPGERGPQSTYVDPTSNGSQAMKAGNLVRGAMERVTPFDLDVSLSDPYPSQSANENITPLSSAVSDVDGEKGKAPTSDYFGHMGKIIRSQNDTSDTDAPPLGNFHTRPLSHMRRRAFCSLFHKGVSRNGCAASPRIGTCFNTKVKLKRLQTGRIPEFPRTLNLARHKLDSRFVRDVTFIDGTMMAPCTVFTKIWRIRNIGTLVWPKGTQLVWIEGDNFSDSHSVDLEVPEEGVPVDKELDVAVDFIAPTLSGTYISYWGMASPSGEKFGQHVWVHIQVDASLKNPFYGSLKGWKLDTPLDVSSSKGTQITDINVQPTEDDAFQSHVPNAFIVPNSEMIDKQQMQMQMQQLVNIYNKTVSAAFAPETFAMGDNKLRQKMGNYFNEAAATANSVAAPTTATYAATAIPETYAATAAPATYAAAATNPATYAAGSNAYATYAAGSNAYATYAGSTAAPATYALATATPEAYAAAAADHAALVASIVAPETYDAAAASPETYAAAVAAPETYAAAAAAPETYAAAAAAPETYAAAAAAPETYAAAAAAPETYAAAAAAPETYAAAAAAPETYAAAAAPETYAAAAAPETYAAAAAPETYAAVAATPATDAADAVTDFSETTPDVSPNQQSAAVDAPSSSLEVGGNNSNEEPLLKELEEMGFKQIDLNNEIPRLNEYNMEQSVDNLYGVSEWDTILLEWHEMGFHNNEMNKKLHMKNNGNIDLIVSDLLEEEHAYLLS
ncbi:unnamed protein product [Lupinus luteus]|uniref:PB1 domain-containing protein n=1 Tax=Lupinus luteus TaxID=3873 RepID=A0AAV1WCN3_LUPLU